MEHSMYGYARVSTREQHEDRQMAALTQFGVAAEKIYLDKASGKDFNRPAYRRLMRRLKPGDLLAVQSIDRLGRNYQEIIAQWRIITQEKGVDIVVLDMPLLDTRQSGDLTGRLIADLVLQLLSYVAQTEREFIRARQAEGIAAAKARGVTFGPRPRPRPTQYPALLEAWEKGMLSARAAARQLGVSHKTFLKWARSDKETTFLQKQFGV